MKKILIINPFGIGDVLFTTPLVSALRDNIEGLEIAYWCNERVAPLLKDNPRISKLFALSRGDIKEIARISKYRAIKSSALLFCALKKEHFDLCFDFSLDHRYSLIAKLAGIKRRIGFNYKGRGRLLTEKTDITGYSDKHVVEYCLELLKFLHLEPKNRNLELFLSPEIKEIASSILKDYGIREDELIIGIAPGAGRSWGRDAALRHWPAANFAALIDRISEAHPAKILILGDPSEENIAGEILSKIHYRVSDLTGKTNLGELAAIIGKLGILVANDGGPLHIAVAQGRKTVSFFGPVDPRVYGPYPPDKRKHIILRKDLACSPCYRNFRFPECANAKKCLEDISVEEAFCAVASLL